MGNFAECSIAKTELSSTELRQYPFSRNADFRPFFYPLHSELSLNLAGEILNFGGTFKHFPTQTNIRFLWRGVHRKYVNHVLKAICQANFSQQSQLVCQIQTQFTVCTIAEFSLAISLLKVLQIFPNNIAISIVRKCHCNINIDTKAIVLQYCQ